MLAIGWLPAVKKRPAPRPALAVVARPASPGREHLAAAAERDKIRRCNRWSQAMFFASPAIRARLFGTWPFGRKIQLRNGQRVVLRPILPEDREPLREGFMRLSIGSRRLRFMSPLQSLSDEQLRYLTEVDYRNHMAWVAADASRPRFGLGVARYVRLDEEPEVGEVAVAVVDSHHGLGLGSLLLYALERSAARNGIRRFRAWVHEENASVIRIARDLGATFRREKDGLLRVEAAIPLTKPPECFRAAARQLPERGLRLVELGSIAGEMLARTMRGARDPG
ncbi:MAG: GNAT family N-acetyltransferase [Myxococcales bacterium]|jgi:RimJ/RimL family protein N-acetyltransferase